MASTEFKGIRVSSLQSLITISTLLFILSLNACHDRKKGEKAEAAPVVDQFMEKTPAAGRNTLPVNRDKAALLRAAGHFMQGEAIDVATLPVLSLHPFGIEYEILPVHTTEPLLRVDAFIDTELIIENVLPSAWPLELTLSAPDGKNWQEVYQFDSESNTIKNAAGRLVGSKNETIPGDLYSIDLNFNASLPRGSWTFHGVFRDPGLKSLSTVYAHQTKRLSIRAEAEINPLGERRTDTFHAGEKIYISGADAPPAAELMLVLYRYATEDEVEDDSLLDPQLAECGTKLLTDQAGCYETIFTVGPEITKGSYIIAKGTAPDKLELVYFSGQFDVE